MQVILNLALRKDHLFLFNQLRFKSIFQGRPGKEGLILVNFCKICDEITTDKVF